ncbi:hypothetical protein IFR05_002088 [Cadophora sp. M221]|nr:hypothetical protein IFR05_002088 [Cadophora sp. M221]
MPKAERRTSGARAAPYPAIRPGDKPRSTSSTSKPASEASIAKNTTKTSNAKSKTTTAKSATKKALEDKPSTSVNIPPKTKSASKTKRAVPAPTHAPAPAIIKELPEEAPAPINTPSTKNPSPKPKSSTKKAPPKSKATPKTNEDVATKGDATTFLEITLPGEPTNTVPMHDTCATLRHKINDLLGKDNKKAENGNPAEKKKDGTLKPFTKASFVRAIGCSPKTLDTFLAAKKMMAGAESPVYPAAYIFFEKKRIWEGKKKTAGRLKVELDRPNGLAFRDPNHMRIFVRAGENPADFLDEYGHRPHGLKLWDPTFRRLIIGPGEHVSDFLDKYESLDDGQEGQAGGGKAKYLASGQLLGDALRQSLTACAMGCGEELMTEEEVICRRCRHGVRESRREATGRKKMTNPFKVGKTLNTCAGCFEQNLDPTIAEIYCHECKEMLLRRVAEEKNSGKDEFSSWKTAVPVVEDLKASQINNTFDSSTTSITSTRSNPGLRQSRLWTYPNSSRKPEDCQSQAGYTADDDTSDWSGELYSDLSSITSTPTKWAFQPCIIDEVPRICFGCFQPNTRIQISGLCQSCEDLRARSAKTVPASNTTAVLKSIPEDEDDHSEVTHKTQLTSSIILHPVSEEVSEDSTTDVRESQLDDSVILAAMSEDDESEDEDEGVTAADDPGAEAEELESEDWDVVSSNEEYEVIDSGSGDDEDDEDSVVI